MAFRGPVRSLGALLIVAASCARPAAAQTPTPLANWQYSAGEVLASLAGPLPKWRVTLGPGFDVKPTYTGAKRYTVEPSTITDVRDRDIAFLSDGEGIGVNLLHGEGYRAGFAVSHDLGRNHHDDPRLRELRDVAPAAGPKLFVEYFLEPVVLSADIRKGIGGHDGIVGNLAAHIPLPHRRTRLPFRRARHRLCGRPIHARLFRRGCSSCEGIGAGLGATAVYIYRDHWLSNADLAYKRLLGDAADSPITATKNQFTLDLNAAYMF